MPPSSRRVALEALGGEQTASALAIRFGVHPTMIDQWKRALTEGASCVFERGGGRAPTMDEDQVEELHAKIGEMAVANSSFGEKGQALVRDVRHGMIERGHPERLCCANRLMAGLPLSPDGPVPQLL